MTEKSEIVIVEPHLFGRQVDRSEPLTGGMPISRDLSDALCTKNIGVQLVVVSTSGLFATAEPTGAVGSRQVYEVMGQPWDAARHLHVSSDPISRR
jgi:hypothetical protein